jgi:hypothetical protein
LIAIECPPTPSNLCSSTNSASALLLSANTKIRTTRKNNLMADLKGLLMLFLLPGDTFVSELK